MKFFLSLFISFLVRPLLPTLVGVEEYCCMWSHSDTQHSAWRLWTRDRSVARASTWQHPTLTRQPRDNPQSQQASGRRPTPLTALPPESACFEFHHLYTSWVLELINNLPTLITKPLKSKFDPSINISSANEKNGASCIHTINRIIRKTGISWDTWVQSTSP